MRIDGSIILDNKMSIKFRYEGQRETLEQVLGLGSRELATGWAELTCHNAAGQEVAIWVRKEEVVGVVLGPETLVGRG